MARPLFTLDIPVLIFSKTSDYSRWILYKLMKKPIYSTIGRVSSSGFDVRVAAAAVNETQRPRGAAGTPTVRGFHVGMSGAGGRNCRTGTPERCPGSVVVTFGEEFGMPRNIAPRNIAIVVIFGFMLTGCGGGGGQLGSRDTAHLTPGEASDAVTQTGLTGTPDFSPGSPSDPATRRALTGTQQLSPGASSSSPPSDVEIYTDMAGSIRHARLHDAYDTIEGGTADGGVATSSSPPAFVLSDDEPISVTGFTGSRYVRTLIKGASDNQFNDDLRQEAILYTDKENADDLHYLDIGYWLWVKPHDAIFGDNDQMFMHLYASGSSFPDLVEVNAQGQDVPTVSGTASYAGQATGLYAKQTEGEYREGGQFTALASLHANFSLAPELDPNSPDPKADFFTRVLGRVHSFLDEEGNSIDSSWSVTLQPVTWDGSEDYEPENYIEGRTGGEPFEKWHFRFHGEITGTGGGMSPDSAAGAFIKKFDNGFVGGAFAVYKHFDRPPR